MTAQPETPAPAGDVALPELTADEIALLTDDEYRLYVRILEAELSERTDVAYVDDPVGWIQDVLGEFLWSKQREIARALVTHRRVAVKSCHGVGKTYLVARLIAWWIQNHTPGDARVVSTAPTGDQVRALLWHEINIAHAKGRLVGRVNQTEWWIGNMQVGMGRKPDDTKPGGMVGVHSLFQLVVLDEADGVAAPLWDAANALATNEDSRIIAIGNPDTAGSQFEKVCRPGSGWHVITIDAHESPNWTGEYVPERLKALLISQSYEADVIKDHGVESPVYLSKVRGRFPTQNANSVIPLTVRERAQQTRPSVPEVMTESVVLGVDVAAGGDRSVIRVLRGGSRLTPEVWRSRHDDPKRLLEEIVEAQRVTQAISIKIDSNGVGWALTGDVRARMQALALRTGRQVTVHGVNVGAASAQPKRFKNLRAELWWTARELCQDGVLDLSYLADDDPMLEELIEPRWFEDAAKRIVVEPKDEIRKRLGRSPDDADAGLLAIYVPPLVERVLVTGQRWAKVPVRR